ncbi:MAG: NCS2 family permease, partial [Pseudomonadota bacterium]
MNNLDRFFELSQRGSNLKTEIRAGVTTFLMMAYILLVNPQILSEAGMPIEDVIAATGIAAAIACIVMGILANFPFALAPGMGLNAFFTYGVVLGLGVSWQSALAAVFVAGLVFLGLSFTGLRTRMINGIPHTLKLAITTGIGLFLAIIGFRNMGLSVDHPATLLTRGSVADPIVFIAIFGIILIATLMALRIKGSILIGIVTITVLYWVLGLATPPAEYVALPSLPKETLMALDFGEIASASFWLVVIAILFVDIFDTDGTLIGVGRQG